MKFTADTEKATIVIEDGDHRRTLPLYSTQAFEELSRLWVNVGWNQKYTYTFSWMGRPIIQLPEDMVRIQEVIFRLKPDVIIETGVAHGGSLIYYASLCAAMGKGRVVGVDIDIRSHNRTAIEAHPLARFVTLIEGDSVATSIGDRVRSLVSTNDVVLVILDSNHTKDHVLRELDMYASMVTVGSYVVVTDGIMRDLSDVPRGSLSWQTDNPSAAALEFAAAHPEFVVEQPAWPFNESELTQNVTHWPNAWLRRTR